MRNYKTDRAIVNGYLPTPHPNGDTSRQHAINYAAGVALLTLCAYVVLWSIIKPFWESLPEWTIILCVPVALIMGISWGSIKLMQFTEEHRDWLYYIETTTGLDINQDGVIGDPESLQSGAILMGVDGIRHRIDTDLTLEEINAVKRLLLLSEKATVRSLTAVVGDRASRLREELMKLKICARPTSPRSAAYLTDPGKKAVRRW